MHGYYLQRKAPKNIQLIQIMFPFVEHSITPLDPIFDISETKLRIANPEQYHAIIAENPTVLKLGEKWEENSAREFKPIGP